MFWLPDTGSFFYRVGHASAPRSGKHALFVWRARRRRARWAWGKRKTSHHVRCSLLITDITGSVYRGCHRCSGRTKQWVLAIVDKENYLPSLSLDVFQLGQSRRYFFLNWRAPVFASDLPQHEKHRQDYQGLFQCNAPSSFLKVVLSRKF